MKRLNLAILLLATGCGGAAQDTSTEFTDGTVHIYAIQGSGPVSSRIGTGVIIQGVVTGDFQSNDVDPGKDLGGFYVQDEVGDGDPATSDGIFVFDGRSPAVDVSVGDRVRVRAKVVEHFGETQLQEPDVTVTGRGTIQATDIEFPVRNAVLNSDSQYIADLEAFEGMLLRVVTPMTLSEVRNVDRFGELRLASGGRAYQFTNGAPPGVEEYRAYRMERAARSLILDDGHRESNVTPARYIESPTGTVRVGNEVRNASGNLRYSRGSGSAGREDWRLMPIKDPVIDISNPRPGAPDVGGTLKIASFNVLNFFTGIDNGKPVCGPGASSNCRGADSDDEYHRQLSKIVRALSMINADIVGLVELENNPRDSLAKLVDAVNDSIGVDTYTYVDSGAIGDSAIKVGLIYKSGTVSLRGDFRILDATVDAQFNDIRNRPVLAQTFETRGGDQLTVLVAHLKSKGSGCNDLGDPNIRDGQGNCNRTRTRAATAMANWALTNPTDSESADILIIGDLNAYLREDPVVAIEGAGFVNLLSVHTENPYSFVFDANSGALDHALASASLASRVKTAIEWHINADEPRVLDYNLENRDPALFDGTTPYRSSDHDPIVIGLDL